MSTSLVFQYMTCMSLYGVEMFPSSCLQRFVLDSSRTSLQIHRQLRTMSLSVRNGTKRSLPTVGATILHFLACHFAHVNTTSCSGTDGSVVGHLSLKVQLSGFRLFHGLGPGPMARYVYSSMNDLVHVTLYKCKSFLCLNINYKITQTVTYMY